MTFSHEENGLIFSNLGKRSTLKSKQLSHIMKTETLANLYSSLCLGICVGPGPEAGKGFEGAEKGLCVAGLEIISPDEPGKHMALGDSTVSVKCLGCVLPSRHLREI